MSQTVAVVGATGRQGGAVARHMLELGWNIRALSRHPAGPSAQALQRLGMTVVKADLDDHDSLATAFAGCEHVFAVTDYWEAGFRREIAQGQNIIRAAQIANVDHVLFSSVGATDRTAGLRIRHFDSKGAIEAQLAASQLEWTILRPVTFLENFRTPRYLRTISKGGRLLFGFAPSRPFQFVAVNDLAHFAGLAFSGDAQIRGRATEIASDIISMEELTLLLERRSGKKLKYKMLSKPEMLAIVALIYASGGPGKYRAGPSLIAQFDWHNTSADGGWAADIPALRAIHPQLSTAASWVDSFDWATG